MREPPFSSSRRAFAGCGRRPRLIIDNPAAILHAHATLEQRVVTRIDPSSLQDALFPRSSQYDGEWLTEGSFGANPLWLTEWVSDRLALNPGMRVLDLGCGRAKSSVFLAREFGVDVWAVDLWTDPTENWQRVRDAGVQKSVRPLRGDARRLPFAHRYFDAVIAIDSFQYFGTDALFLPYIVQYLKPSGSIAFASAGLVKDFENGIPGHLSRFWTPDAWCLRTCAWWQEHWARTGLVDIRFAETMVDGGRLWLRWAKACGCSNWYLEALERDAGEFLGYVGLIADRRPDTPDLPIDLVDGR
jgi:ubiquinone/menaquinone biosynthesis C-methylase UbiE